jgi:hypothetical protein
MKLTFGSSYSEKTKKYYQDTINRLEKKGITSLLDTDKVIQAIEEGNPSTNTKKTYYAVVRSALDSLMPEITDADAKEKALNVYVKKYSDLWTIIKEQALTQKPTESEEERLISWNEILQVREGLRNLVYQPNGNMDELMNLCLLGCYTYIPPRRVEDFAFMMWAERKPRDGKHNYCVINKQRAYFIFNHYKTEKTYGQQIILIPKELRQMLEDWHKTNTSPFLFIKRDMTPIDEKRLSAHLIELMEQRTGKRAGASIFRHAFITDIRKDDVALADKQEVATQMAHSVQTQELYRRI